ncbi:hypothetical protein K1T71_000347 [Dendrolimus kikuchii]|uniref:Uncharacterized protein n=1 Tax=Dendrolimus kikuchii TaxID=765133 RepID=A0ACC1DJM2_9NEOP|nr:hypothetical protein K1T71_000347 [Dendrolimus kikuchii]
MMMKHLIVLCIMVCFATSTSNTSDDSVRDFIEYVLRIPNPDKILNTVLGRLENNRQQAATKRRLALNDDCDDPTEGLPEYTESLQSSQERDIRQLGSQKHHPICDLVRTIRKLNTKEYEYRPAYYEEVKCKISPAVEIIGSNEICTSLGLSCVQWNKTIHLTRRRYSSDCWETRTMVIPAGCECMWPVHRLGDIKLHV